ncbi:alpha/beta hydrolase [Novosphingobium sp.]|uniref:alpha/beta hydrolase n=1 Tax=Novosphingobium sp. TaxID=1874826 RepID=UPI00286E84C0|nr:alpha/beta hydrolase [Novosphingobium sp.]
MPLRLPRRSLLAGMAGSALLGSGAVSAKIRSAKPAPALISVLPVWNDAPPGGVPGGLVEQEIPRSPTGPADDTAFLHVTRPTLLHCRPAKPNGAAVLLVPGGGYARVAIGRGGAELLRAFAAQGYHAYLLKYRLPGDPWQAGPDAPLQDAQRALRVIRSMARAEGYDASRIALWGGSAGGHLAARLANSASAAYAATDAIDGLALGVKAAILLYPVNHMTGPHAHAQSRQQLLGSRSDEEAAAYAAQAGVSTISPPTFLGHALDDQVVPVENSLSYFAALRAGGVPAELHVQESGGHGFGWNRANGVAWDWPVLALSFLRTHGA